MDSFPTSIDPSDVMPWVRTIVRDPEKKVLINKLVTSVIEILSLETQLENVLNREDISVIIATIFGQNKMMESSGQEGSVPAYQDIYLLAHVILALADKYNLSDPFNNFQNAFDLAKKLNSAHSEANFLGNLDFVNNMGQLTAH